MVRAIHCRVERCANKLRSVEQLLQGAKLVLRRDAVRLRKTLTTLVIRLDDCHTLDLVWMGPSISTVCMKSAVACTHDYDIHCAHRLITPASSAIINDRPTMHDVSTVIAHSA
jgi:hypothetical protein